MTARLFLTLFLLLPSVAIASEKRLNQADFPQQMEVDGQTLVLRNASVLNYLFVDVYSAALLTPEEQALDQLPYSDNPMHLELFYYRSIARDDVIKAAWVALERQYDQATLTRLRPAINEIHQTFSDIQPEDRYSLTLDSQQQLSLRYNGDEIFTSTDPELGQTYIGIWLKENGLSDRRRNQLIAER